MLYSAELQNVNTRMIFEVLLPWERKPICHEMNELWAQGLIYWLAVEN